MNKIISYVMIPISKCALLSVRRKIFKDCEGDSFSWNLTGRLRHRLRARAGNCQRERSGVGQLNIQDIVGCHVARVKCLMRSGQSHVYWVCG